MEESLFVYGSLAPGAPNEHVLVPLGGHWQKAAIRGQLIDEGWGAAMGYPALALDPMGDPVSGYLLTSGKLKDHWGVLDEFEGAAYQRVRATVQTDQGELQAWVYIASLCREA